MIASARALAVALVAVVTLASSGTTEAGRSARPSRAKPSVRKAPAPSTRPSTDRAKAERAARAARAASARKFTRVERFESALPALRKQVDAQLRSPRADKDTAVAAVIRIMDKAYLRIGSERNATRAEKPSFGAASLRKQHVRISGDRVTLTFRGKSGVSWKKTIRDKNLARTLQVFMKTPGERLFSYDAGDGRVSQVTERSVRDYLTPYGALPKDFRTLHANRIFRNEIGKKPAPRNKAELERNIQQAIEAGSTALNHTPAIYQKAYLNPALPREYRRTGMSGRGPPQ